MDKDTPQDAFRHQRLRLLFSQARATSLMALFGATAVALVFLHADPSPAPLAWLAAMLLTTGLRFVVYHRFINTDQKRHPEGHWLKLHGWSAAPVGIAWGSLSLIPLSPYAPGHLHELQLLVPGFVLMAALTSYAVYFSQFVILWATVGGTALVAHLVAGDGAAIPHVVLLSSFLLVLLVTARRFSESLTSSLDSQTQLQKTYGEITQTNNELLRQNSVMMCQQDMLEQEEALARHVFAQLTLGGEHRIPGIHSWNQPMGSLSGDLIHTARGPQGQSYVLLADFTGHGLPAALGALPASSVFLAMAGKGLPLESIACELNNKLHQLLPVGYFCCAVLLELSADRHEISVWNGGLPPVLINRWGQDDFERIPSHALPLGVVDADSFEAKAHHLGFDSRDVLYAYTDGLTEAENIDGEMWGSERLESFVREHAQGSLILPSLIDAVLDHVNLAPASDDISVLEIEATPAVEKSADAA